MDGCQPVAASIRRQHDAGPFVLASHLYNQSLSFGTSGLSLLSRRVWGEFCLKWHDMRRPRIVLQTSLTDAATTLQTPVRKLRAVAAARRGCRTGVHGEGLSPQAHPHRVYWDADATMRPHVTLTVQASLAILRQIRRVRHSVPPPAMLTLFRTLVISKLDYCNTVLAGAPEVLLRRVQSVLNDAARLVSLARKSEDTSSFHYSLLLNRRFFPCPF